MKKKNGKVTRRELLKLSGLFMGTSLLGGGLLNSQKAFAQDIKLPEQSMKNSIMEALKNRKSTRSYDGTELSDQELSEVLWAAFGINRSDGKRTAPSGANTQETDIYVLLKKGSYLYNPQENKLELVSKENLQHIMFTQPYAESVPVHLIFVSNVNEVTDQLPPEYTLLHSGFISQNVSLYCAAVGLGTVVRSPRSGGELNKALKLSENQKITLWQAVGHPGEASDKKPEKGGGRGFGGGSKPSSSVVW